MPGTELLPGATSKRHFGRGPDDRRAMGEIVLRRRNEGTKMFVIAAELQVSEPTAYAYMKLALDARIAPTVDEYRRQQNDVLDERTEALNVQLAVCNRMLTTRDEHGEAVSPSMALALMAERRQTLLALAKMDERRAKLNGLDAPVKIDAQVTHHDADEAEFEQIVAESQAKAARERDREKAGMQ